MNTIILVELQDRRMIHHGEDEDGDLYECPNCGHMEVQ